MTYWEELLALIENGTSPADIYSHFDIDDHLSRAAIIDFLDRSGVTFRLPPMRDEISDERRLELQELSLSD